MAHPEFPSIRYIARPVLSAATVVKTLELGQESSDGAKRIFSLVLHLNVFDNRDQLSHPPKNVLDYRVGESSSCRFCSAT